jgi:O-antigen/teichoic acid export membrane protein
MFDIVKLRAEMQSPLKDIVYDASRYFPSRWVQAMASIVSVVVLARLMTPADYGTYVVLLTCSTLLSTFTFNWVTASAFRFYEEALQSSNLPELYRELGSCYLAMSVAWLGIGGAVFWLIVNRYIEVSVAGVVWLVLLGLLDPMVTIYQSIKMAGRQVKNAVTVVISDSLLRCMLGIGGALLFADKVGGVLAGQFVACGIVVSVLAFRVRSQFFLWWGRVNRGRVWTFISYGYPMAGASISSWVLSVSDRLLLNWMLGASAVGVYSAGYQLGSNSILLPSSGLMAGAFPVVIHEYERRGQEPAAKLLTNLVTGVLIAGSALVIFLGIVSEAIVKVLLGHPYTSAAAVIPVVALGQLLMALSEYFAKSFQLKKQTSALFIITLIAAFVNVLANLVLIPWIGIMGSAVATVLAYGVALAITASYSHKLLPIRLPLGSLWRIAFAIVGPCLVLFWLQPILRKTPVIAGLLGLLGVGLFVATLWVTREPTVVTVARLIFDRKRREVKEWWI